MQCSLATFLLLEIALYVGNPLFAELMDFLPWKTFHRIVARHGLCRMNSVIRILDFRQTLFLVTIIHDNEE